MSIVGKWKITDANVFDMSFKQSWRKVADVLADENVHPMQKGMARAVYVFGEDGKALMLIPKGIAPAGEAESYDDDYDLMKASEWKEEGGKLYIAAFENGNTEWNEIVPDGDGFILFDMHRVEKA